MAKDLKTLDAEVRAIEAYVKAEYKKLYRRSWIITGVLCVAFIGTFFFPEFLPAVAVAAMMGISLGYMLPLYRLADFHVSQKDEVYRQMRALLEEKERSL